MTKTRTFSGTSKQADLKEALANAILAAKEGIPTDYVEWRLIELSGKDGGYVLLQDLSVLIEVSVPD
jgi:hypothetical protein